MTPKPLSKAGCRYSLRRLKQSSGSDLHQVSLQLSHSSGVTPIGALRRQVLLTGLFLGGVGAIAVGASGLLALVIRVVGGTRVLVGVPSARVLTASNCARWLANRPGTRYLPGRRRRRLGDRDHCLPGRPRASRSTGAGRLRVDRAPSPPPLRTDVAADRE